MDMDIEKIRPSFCPADWQRILPLLVEVSRTLALFPDLVDLGDALAKLGIGEFHTHPHIHPLTHLDV